MNTWTMRLIVANAVVFLITIASPAVTSLFMFVPHLVLERPWTIVTYMFLHAGFMHILFNMMGLFFFGPRVEAELGGRDFLLLYFISGIAGALLSFVTPYVAIVGASGAVFGVFLAFARLFPKEIVFFWMIPMQAKWMVVIMTVLSLIGGVGGGGDIAHFAHLGGFVGGYLFLLVRGRSSRAAQFQRKLAVLPVTGADVERWNRIDRNRLHEVNRTELERVLAKIERSGPGSLSPEERAFLDRFSS